jgi:hypothetical protein
LAISHAFTLRVVDISSTDHIGLTIRVVMYPSTFCIANDHTVMPRAARSAYRAFVEPSDYYRSTSVYLASEELWGAVLNEFRI